MPAARAARAIADLAVGVSDTLEGDGRDASGIESLCPSTVVSVVQPATSTSTRGRSCQRWNAATLSRSVSSSPAPPGVVPVRARVEPLRGEPFVVPDAEQLQF